MGQEYARSIRKYVSTNRHTPWTRQACNGRSLVFFYPGHLYRFEDFLTRLFRIIVKVGQFSHPAVQISKPNLLRVDVGMGI